MKQLVSCSLKGLEIRLFAKHVELDASAVTLTADDVENVVATLSWISARLREHAGRETAGKRGRPNQDEQRRSGKPTASRRTFLPRPRGKMP